MYVAGEMAGKCAIHGWEVSVGWTGSGQAAGVRMEVKSMTVCSPVNLSVLPRCLVQSSHTL